MDQTWSNFDSIVQGNKILVPQSHLQISVVMKTEKISAIDEASRHSSVALYMDKIAHKIVSPKLDLNKGMDAHAVHLVGLPCSSPWLMKRNPILVHPTSPLRHLHSKRVRELRVQGRGFGVPISDKKRREEENDSIYNNNEGGEEEEDALPQVVFNRMMGRVVFCVGFPVASGVSLVYLLSSLKEQRLWDLPGWLPLLSTLLAFGTSALGIACGTLSTSWDPDKEGSLLGWEQVEKNWPELWRGEENERR